MTNDNERAPIEVIEETTTTLIHSYDKDGQRQTIEVLSAGRAEVLGAWVR